MREVKERAPPLVKATRGRQPRRPSFPVQPFALQSLRRLQGRRKQRERSKAPLRSAPTPEKCEIQTSGLSELLWLKIGRGTQLQCQARVLRSVLHEFVCELL